MTEYVSQVAAHIRGETQNHLRPDAVIDQILICLFAEGHALLEARPEPRKL